MGEISKFELFIFHLILTYIFFFCIYSVFYYRLLMGNLNLSILFRKRTQTPKFRKLGKYT